MKITVTAIALACVLGLATPVFAWYGEDESEKKLDWLVQQERQRQVEEYDRQIRQQSEETTRRMREINEESANRVRQMRGF